METYVGFSSVSGLTYSNNGSYITDFFVDLDVAFTPENVKLFSQIIKIYATQKLNQFQPEPIPPAQPPVNTPPQVLAVATLKSGDTISVLSAPMYKRYTIVRNSAGVVLFEGLEKAINKPPTLFNQELIDETIVIFYGSVSTNPNAPQYIVQLENPAPPQYPQIPNPQSKEGLSAFYKVMTNYLLTVENFQNKVIDSLMIKLQKALPNVNNTPEAVIDSVLELSLIHI